MYGPLKHQAKRTRRTRRMGMKKPKRCGALEHGDLAAEVSGNKDPWGIVSWGNTTVENGTGNHRTMCPGVIGPWKIEFGKTGQKQQ